VTEAGKYVRWANEKDAESLAALNDEFNGTGVTKGEVEKSIAGTNEMIAVAILNDEAVGFACAQCFESFCYRGSQAEITEMYIRETARRKGLASMLISFLEQQFRERGVKSVKIVTGSSNESAIITYERSNYVRKDYIIFQKKL